MIRVAAEGASVSNVGTRGQAVLFSTSRDSIFGLSEPSPGLEPASGSTPPSEPAPRPWWRHGCFPRALIVLGVLAFFSEACLDACTGSNRIRHVPTIHGRVVDMETGRPLAGMRITRYFVRDEIGGPGGGDQSVPSGSWHTATSQADGTFTLPGWWGLRRGIGAIKWGEFKPGWTAAWGELLLHGTPQLEIAKNYPSANAALAETRREGSHLTVLLKLHRVDTPQVAEDHFWALRVLLQERLVTLDEVVTDAHQFLSKHNATIGMVDPLSDLICRMGNRPARRTFVQQVEALCCTPSPPVECQHVSPRYVINVLAAKDASR